jgi:hypothetical protein
MQRKSPYDDALARAKQYCKPDLARVNLDEIGFWERNRGGEGVCPHHVHEIAHHIKNEMTQVQRYQYVDLIKIPKDSLQKVLKFNCDRCEADPLMPRFSLEIRYVCTRFVHAQKLAKDGTHTLYNRGEDPVRWHDADTEGAQIMEHGPLCAFYSKRMFKDIEAAHAVANQQLGRSCSQHEGWVHSPSQWMSECDSE